MVLQGYANASRYPPDVACADTFGQAESEARNSGVGLWGEQPTAEATAAATVAATQETSSGQPSISIGYIFYDGVEGRQEPDEYVEIANGGSSPVDLAGWTLQDESGKTFRFPSYQIQPGETCRIYTNQDSPEYCGFSFKHSGSAIWNNGGDCAMLKNNAGQVIDEKCY